MSAPVLCPGCLIMSGCNGAFLAVAYSGDLQVRKARTLYILLRRMCAPFPQCEVILGSPPLVAMPFDSDLHSGESFQKGGFFVQNPFCRLCKRISVVVKVDILILEAFSLIQKLSFFSFRIDSKFPPFGFVHARPNRRPLAVLLSRTAVAGRRRNVFLRASAHSGY